tara:strand:- start:113 stop:316 length:204 start_codon:yes stop_codon:yes gene_type:complete
MDKVNITKGQLREALDKVEKQALQQVEDYFDELAPDDEQFVECVIRDMVVEMWLMVFPHNTMPKEEQ